MTDTGSSCSNEENTKYSDAKSNWMRGWSVLGTIRRTVCHPVLQLFKGCNLSLSFAIILPTYTFRAEFLTMIVTFEVLLQCFAEMTMDCENIGQNWNIPVCFCLLFYWDRRCHVMVLIFSVEKYLCSVPSVCVYRCVRSTYQRETQKLQVFLDIFVHILQLPYRTKFVFVNISEEISFILWQKKIT